MKTNIVLMLYVLVVIIFISNVNAYTIDDYQDIIFLHHSTGGNVYSEGDVSSWFSNYNTVQGTSYNMNERAYPNTPYPWNNYPYDYWNLWINGACDSLDSDIECLNTLVQDYSVIIWKHCFPSSAILADTGNADITSSVKRIENYKLQYNALREIMDNYPETIFILWTLPPLHRLATNVDDAQRATNFSDWMKTDFLLENGTHSNIYIFDFREIVVGPDNYLAYGYERSHSSSDSHPNTAANEVAGPIFSQFIVDSINDFVSNKCNLTYDKTECGTIDSGELNNVLVNWLQGFVNLNEWLNYIRIWKS